MILKRAKLSVLWHQGWLPDGSVGELPLDPYAYETTVATPRSEQAGPLTSPWPVSERQMYWQRYLRRSPTLRGAPVRDVFRALVPLRGAAAPLDLLADGEDARVASEGFLHHWGGTLVVNLDLSGEWTSLDALADRIVELRRERCFSTTGGDGPAALDELAEAGLDALRAAAASASAGTVCDGFSVFSLATASGELAEFDPTVAASGAHRFLHAVTALSANWREETPRPLEEARVAGQAKAPSSHFVYGADRARAIWSPTRFRVVPPPPGTLPKRRKPTVACHHRNLVLASMQTEALARFSADAAERLAGNLGLSSQHDLLARCAAGKLAEIYGGDLKTYRSRSLPVQIDDAQLLAPINAVRAKYSMPKIA